MLGRDFRDSKVVRSLQQTYRCRTLGDMVSKRIITPLWSGATREPLN